MELLSVWWAWVVLGAGLAVLEVLVPGFIFLGFAIGAVLMAVLVGLGVSVGPALALLLFAILSLISWAGLRAGFGVRDKDVKVWHDDINDN